jgi:hypothetical protein
MDCADAMIEKYGSGITVRCAAGVRTARGFISPLDFAEYENLSHRTRPGAVGRAKYLLIAESCALTGEEESADVECGGRLYELVRFERVGTGADMAHWEGVLRLKGGAGNA